jgi:hypothetical protein
MRLIFPKTLKVSDRNTNDPLAAVLLRWFSVCHNAAMSLAVDLVCSVPHGPVLGNLLFKLYTSGLADIAAVFNVCLYAYADYALVHLRCNRALLTEQLTLFSSASMRLVDEWRLVI